MSANDIDVIYISPTTGFGYAYIEDVLAELSYLHHQYTYCTYGLSTYDFAAMHELDRFATEYYTLSFL